MRELPIEYLRRRILYDPMTGDLVWKPRPDPDFPSIRIRNIWNKKYLGHVALNSLEATGYLTGRIDGLFFKAHRVAWALFHGEFPKEAIDHIDGDKTNNRISNLRLANKQQNAANMQIRRSNLCGLKGVSRARKRWRAAISIKGKNFNLGHFDTKEEAHKRYCEVAIEHFGEYARFA